MAELLIDANIDPDRIADLERATGSKAAHAPGEHESRRSLPSGLIRDTRAMLCTYLPDNHAEMKSLEFVQLCSAGFAQVENAGLAARRVRVCSASGVNDIPIAEWAIAMMVSLARDLPTMFRNQQQGIWDRGKRFQTEIRGRTLGIWGYGGIGRQTTRLARAMGLRVHVLTRDGKADSRPRFRVDGTGDDDASMPHRFFSMNQLSAFLEPLDFLMLAIPLTPQNVGIITREVLEGLPRSAFLLNPARGPLVNENDLLDALRRGLIAGAALDAHFKYPMPPDHPLWQMSNVIMTPHISGSSKSSHFVARIWELFADNVGRWQQGRPLLNELSSHQLEPAAKS